MYPVKCRSGKCGRYSGPMKKLLEYCKITIFVMAVLSGVQVPGFIDQYGKSLAAHVAESNTSMAAFQDDAERFFKGDILQLIAHYDKTDDPVFVEGGGSIRALVLRNQQLLEAHSAYQSSLLSRYAHVFLSPLTEIQTEVWGSFTHSIVLNKEAIIFGVFFGLMVLAMCELLLWVLACLKNRIFKQALG